MAGDKDNIFPPSSSMPHGPTEAPLERQIAGAVSHGGGICQRDIRSSAEGGPASRMKRAADKGMRPSAARRCTCQWPGLLCVLQAEGSRPRPACHMEPQAPRPPARPLGSHWEGTPVCGRPPWGFSPKPAVFWAPFSPEVAQTNGFVTREGDSGAEAPGPGRRRRVRLMPPEGGGGAASLSAWLPAGG